ncbi:MAG: MauE/DoxX family redox-associated membrane protein [Tepidisphaeraceae bacterium]|jgi:uncharacterized membrane protein YphA (DoxX/SURF4 family)
MLKTSENFRGNILGVLRVTLGAMFVWSALMKIERPMDFLDSVYQYQLFGAKADLLLAICIPWAELVAAICLLGGIFLNGAFVLTTLLGAGFVFAVGSALERGLNISCGCFASPSDSQIGYGTLLRSISVLAGGLIGLLLVRRVIPNNTLPEQSSPHPQIHGSH